MHHVLQADTAGLADYEFDTVEQKTFSSLMDSIRGTGTATALLCLGHFMACAAKLFSAAEPSGQYAPLNSEHRHPITPIGTVSGL